MESYEERCIFSPVGLPSLHGAEEGKKGHAGLIIVGTEPQSLDEFVGHGGSGQS